MSDKAKCRLCQDTIQASKDDDYIKCSCGEIGIHSHGGNTSFYARDWDNFFFVDDKGQEIIPIIKQIEDKEQVREKLTREQLLEMLDKFIADIEGLPPVAMQTYINHYDYLNLLTLIRALFRE